MTQEESKDEEWRYNGKDSMGEGELGEERKKKKKQNKSLSHPGSLKQVYYITI